MLPNIFLIVLNWNGRLDTLECLSTVTKVNYPRFEIVVVDNGSTDGSAESIASEFPGVLLIRTGENLGYAGGNNRGISYALANGADYIFLLNNDTTVDVDILANFIRATKAFPGAGVYGAKIYYHSHPQMLWFAGGEWRREKMNFVHTGGGEIDGENFSHPRSCDYVTGCALFASAEVFRAIGLLNESFFLTYEETDWCYRARAKGYNPMFIPDAKVWHKVSAAFGGTGSPLQRYFFTRNRLLWGRYHLPARDRARLHWKSAMTIKNDILPKFFMSKEASSIIKRFAWSWRTWAITLKRNTQKPENLAMLYGIRDYYFNRLGNCPDKVRQLNQLARKSGQHMP